MYGVVYLIPAIILFFYTKNNPYHPSTPEETIRRWSLNCTIIHSHRLSTSQPTRRQAHTKCYSQRYTVTLLFGEATSLLSSSSPNRTHRHIMLFHSHKIQLWVSTRTKCSFCSSTVMHHSLSNFFIVGRVEEYHHLNIHMHTHSLTIHKSRIR